MNNGFATDEAFLARYQAKVGRAGLNECWSWLACVSSSGYGCIGYKKKMLTASRVAWELEHGPIPGGLVVCHKCDNPRCCNPHHLFLGTQHQNILDSASKGRHRSKTRPDEGCGANHHHANLNEWSACGVLARRLMGAPIKEVAEEHGITTSTVSKIALGQCWNSLFGREWE